MDDFERKKMAIISAYGSKTWKDKVSVMTEQQVIAIYLSFIKQGKIK